MTTNNGYNGYANWETWNFMNYESEYLFDMVMEYAEDSGLQEVEYGQVYEIIDGYIDEMLEIQDVPTDGFIGDIVSHVLSDIDVHGIAETICEEVNEELAKEVA